MRARWRVLCSAPFCRGVFRKAKLIQAQGQAQGAHLLHLLRMIRAACDWRGRYIKHLKPYKVTRCSTLHSPTLATRTVSTDALPRQSTIKYALSARGTTCGAR
eukprot:scaffold85288_cov75-Phaeocystis_antarctica.AAC.3